MATSRHIATDRDRFGPAANDGAVVFVGSQVEVDHRCSCSCSDGVALNFLAGSGQLEVSFMVCDLVEVVCPNGEGAWCD